MLPPAARRGEKHFFLASNPTYAKPGKKYQIPFGFFSTSHFALIVFEVMYEAKIPLEKAVRVDGFLFW